MRLGLLDGTFETGMGLTAADSAPVEETDFGLTSMNCEPRFDLVREQVVVFDVSALGGAIRRIL